MDTSISSNHLLVIAIFSVFLFLASSSCSNHTCVMLDPCSSPTDCAAGLLCNNCAASGKNNSFCVRGQTIDPSSIINNLPFNKYSWIVTHNAFSIRDGTPRGTYYNQEDSVTNQLRNGVRGLMLDMYDFRDDIWLCHSFQGRCFSYTAFRPAITTLKEVEAFLSANPSDIVTIIIEDYVHAPKGLIKLFTDAGLLKFLYPTSEMPTNGKDWPKITDMISKNHRLLVFSSNASKEAEDGIAYQWRYFLENEPGNPGQVQGSCPNRKESQPLNSRAASLFLMNYFPTNPVERDACKENSNGLVQMVDTCNKTAGNLMPNFVAVNYYMRSDGGGVFDVVDKINGLNLCGCSTVTACQDGSPRGVCKNSRTSSGTPKSTCGGLHMVILLSFLIMVFRLFPL